jgi:predicted house-cleaning noncanonical NTP pyrophosphatase (MazG superfamily)
MTVKKFNKLVRDKIPKIIENKGKTCKFRIASPLEYRQKLKEKLLEESQEFFENPCVEEFADIQEVMDALRIEYGLNGIEAYKHFKEIARGSFSKKIILEEVTE